MKKLFGLLLIAIIALSSCADSKTFERADGTKFVAEPYGWANYQTKKIEGVTYEACIGNIVWDEVDESAYYSHSIEEFDGNSTEWEEYGGEVYGREG